MPSTAHQTLTRVEFTGEITDPTGTLVVVETNKAQVESPKTVCMRILANVALTGYLNDKNRGEGCTGTWKGIDDSPDESAIPVRVVATGFMNTLRVVADTDDSTHHETVDWREGQQYFLEKAA